MNTDSASARVVGVLFTASGTALAYLQLFIQFPISLERSDPRPEKPIQISRARRRSLPRIKEFSPTTQHGWALIASGCAVVFAHADSIQTRVSRDEMLAILSGFIIAGVLEVFGFLGFYGATESQGKALPLAAASLSVAGASVSAFGALASYVSIEGGYGFSQGIIQLNRVDAAVISSASLLVALCVWVRQETFSQWTAWASLLFSAANALVAWHPVFLTVLLLRLAGMLHGAVLVHFGYRIAQIA